MRMSKRVYAVPIALLVVAVATIPLVERFAFADHFDPPNFARNMTFDSCGTNCQEYEFTLTVKTKGSYCKTVKLKRLTGLESAGVSDAYFGSSGTNDTTITNLCESTGSKSATYTVETDGGNENSFVQLELKCNATTFLAVDTINLDTGG